MPEARPSSAPRLRNALFVALAACTLWLMVENAILLVVLPHLLAETRVETRHE